MPPTPFFHISGKDKILAVIPSTNITNMQHATPITKKITILFKTHFRDRHMLSTKI